MEKTVKQRLVEFIAALNITQAEFQRRCNLSSGYINNMVNGIGAAKLDQILSEYPLLNAKWLLTGEGEMLKPQQPQVQQNNYNGNNNYVVGNGNSVQCSDCEIVEVEEIECPNCGEKIEVQTNAIVPCVPSEIVSKPDLNLSKWIKSHPHQMENVDMSRIWGDNIFVIPVDTRAMEPEYREGSYLVLRKLPDLSYARADGTPYVVDTLRPHTLFRYLTKDRDGGYVLTAESDKRGPIYLRAEEIVNVYDIVGSFRVGR